MRLENDLVPTDTNREVLLEPALDLRLPAPLARFLQVSLRPRRVLGEGHHEGRYHLVGVVGHVGDDEPFELRVDPLPKGARRLAQRRVHARPRRPRGRVVVERARHEPEAQRLFRIVALLLDLRPEVARGVVRGECEHAADALAGVRAHDAARDLDGGAAVGRLVEHHHGLQRGEVEALLELADGREEAVVRVARVALGVAPRFLEARRGRGAHEGLEHLAVP